MSKLTVDFGQMSINLSLEDENSSNGESLISDTRYYSTGDLFFTKGVGIKLKYNDIYVFGFSLGTAPASYLAEAKKPKGVILGAPFYSLKEVAGEKNIPLAKYIIKYEMPSYKYVKNYKGDLLIVHGTDDMVIPAHHGKSLYELSSSNSKKLVLLPKTGHNDLFFNNKGAHPHIIDWINSH